MPIRVLIADDHPLFRAALRDALTRVGDIDVVGEVGTGRSAVAQSLELKPDVVLLDLLMPDGTGVEAAEDILQASPGTRVLVLTAVEDVETFLRAIKVGVAGFVLKDIAIEHLVAGIRAVHREGTMINPGLARHLLQAVASQPRDADRTLPGFSNRETTILRDVARGLSDKEIAAGLFLSESTIKTHLRSLYRKLGVKNRTQAVTHALQTGLISKRDFVGSKKVPSQTASR